MQVVVFDLEFGQPAASSSLPASRPPFRDILGCFGHQAIGKDVTEGGIDVLCCSHQVPQKAIWLARLTASQRPVERCVW